MNAQQKKNWHNSVDGLTFYKEKHCPPPKKQENTVQIAKLLLKSNSIQKVTKDQSSLVSFINKNLQTMIFKENYTYLVYNLYLSLRS